MAAPVLGFTLPEPLRSEFSQVLGAADESLRALARVAIPAAGSRTRLESAVYQAWSELLRVERTVGLSGIVRADLPSRRIVVVDDSEDMRFLVSRALQLLVPWARVEVACDGRQALALLADAEEGEGVVVISDYSMGEGATGADLLAEVATRHPKAQRVLFTGHPPERVKLGASEPHAVLSKDAGTDALRLYFRSY